MRKSQLPNFLLRHAAIPVTSKVPADRRGRAGQKAIEGPKGDKGSLFETHGPEALKVRLRRMTAISLSMREIAKFCLVPHQDDLERIRAIGRWVKENLMVEARERSSTGQATYVGMRNIDISPPIERYFKRRELDKDPVRNDRLYRAAVRLQESYAQSNLEPVGMSKFTRSECSGVPDKFATLRLKAFRDYASAMRKIDEENRAIVSFVVVYEAGHAKDWARLRRIPERGAIQLLRMGLEQLAMHYGLLKRPLTSPRTRMYKLSHSDLLSLKS